VETNPYKLIEATVVRGRARMRENVLWPALPPALAIAAAALLGRLPVEVGAAATIGYAMVLLHLTSQRFERRDAAAFLDAKLGAKEHFLTLATIDGAATLRPAVEERATAIASSAPPPSPPPRRSRPVLLSGFASAALLAFLWWLPQVSLFAAAGGPLDRIAAELAGSSDTTDRRLGAELAALSDALRDPAISKEDKQKKIDEMMKKIDEVEKQQKQSAAAGSSGSGGDSGKQGQQQKPEGEQQGEGKGKGTKQEQQSGEKGSGSGARGEAKKELEKMAGELAGGEQKNQQQGKSEQGKEKKPEPAGGGIKGPEDNSAKERKQGDRQETGNQPGKNQSQDGGNEKQGGAEGQAKADQQEPKQPDQQPNTGKGQGQGSGDGEGASKQPSHQPSDKPAERFFKPGENAGGRIVDGRYVRIRVPEEQKPLAGSEEVGTPGEVIPEVPYGNAPMPPPGGPGDVGTEQPVPLEYRGALGASR
jgi:hypothetical protein